MVWQSRLGPESTPESPVGVDPSGALPSFPTVPSVDASLPFVSSPVTGSSATHAASPMSVTTETAKGKRHDFIEQNYHDPRRTLRLTKAEKNRQFATCTTRRKTKARDVFA